MSRDLAGGLFWLIVAIFVAVHGFALKLGTLGRPGPGFFPFWGAVALGILSVVLLAGSRTRAAPVSVRGVGSPTVFVVAGALLASVVLLERLGFVTVTFIFLLLLFRLARIGWVQSGVAALAGAGACYALFQLWLKTQLPRGPFGF